MLPFSVTIDGVRASARTSYTVFSPSLLSKARVIRTIIAAAAVILMTAACRQAPMAPAQSNESSVLPGDGIAPIAEPIPPTPSAAASPSPAGETPIAALPTDRPQATPTPPIATLLPAADDPCGRALPAMPPEIPTTPSAPPQGSVGDLTAAGMPAIAAAAAQRFLSAPETVALVAYQAGREAEGVSYNADAPMPLASVTKIITLVAYVEAVAAGALNPLEPVALAELDRYYLPNFDLGAHRRAVNELRENGRALDTDPPSVYLEDVPWMMIRHSSNAANDFLLARLGQARIEETALRLGMTNHSAPCSFLGQFLVMANHTRRAGNDLRALEAYVAAAPGSPPDYGNDVAALAEAFSSDPAFRQEEIGWRTDARRPSIETQRYFTEHLNARGAAREYAALAALIAGNGLSNPDSSFLARRYLEWPMRFPANQELFSNLGYKNGALPGVLTTVYYAYRWNDPAPVVVALFYRNLPQRTYRDWRSDLPHDELARWLLADPDAISAMRRFLSP